MAKDAVKADAGAAEAVVEKQTNCPSCNKPIRKLKRYYRNGKFYCNKRCWQKTNKTKGASDDKA